MDDKYLTGMVNPHTGVLTQSIPAIFATLYRKYANIHAQAVTEKKQTEFDFKQSINMALHEVPCNKIIDGVHAFNVQGDAQTQTHWESDHVDAWG